MIPDVPYCALCGYVFRTEKLPHYHILYISIRNE
jgi:hypothetical protein